MALPPDKENIYDLLHEAHKRLSRTLHNSRGVLTDLRNKLLTGVLVAIPLVVTIWVLNLAYRFIVGISAPLLKGFGINFPGLGFVVTLLLLLLLGFMATNVLGKKVLEAFERLLLRVPVVATVYTGVKQVIDSFKAFNTTASFKRVAYVEYPSEGCRLIGFVTGQYFDQVQREEVTTVFIPTAPNPMTGFVIVVASSKVIESELTLEEASKMIVSAGLVVPRRQEMIREPFEPAVIGR